MKKIMLSGMLVLLALLSSCAQKEMMNDNPKMPSREAAVISITPETVIEGLNAFSFDVYRQMLSGSFNNAFISPLSISAALAMTYAGAEGETADQMRRALHYGPQSISFHQDYGYALDSLSRSNDDFEINIANAVWVQNAFPLLPAYVNIVKDLYNSESRELDFVHKPEASRKTINDWVESQTNERIKNLIPKGVIDADTRMVLTNAVYFNAEWMDHFNKSLTRREPFYSFDDEEIICDMMYKRSRLAYSKSDDLQILEIPYKGNQYSMMVLLPEQNDGLKNLIRQIGPSILDKHYKNRQWEDVILYLPKFKLNTDYELKPALSVLGMEIAFSDDADFSGMTGKKDLKISSVIHKAFIEVDEEKTEAAAATAVVMKLTTAMPVQKAPIEFRADHPFLFLIKHNESGAILFMGQLTYPE